MPLDRQRSIQIYCGFHVDPRADVGCTSSTYVSYKHNQIKPQVANAYSALFVRYHFKRVLLPDWEDIHVEIASLFESFETVN